jgi:hypothetical protein
MPYKLVAYTENNLPVKFVVDSGEVARTLPRGDSTILISMGDVDGTVRVKAYIENPNDSAPPVWRRIKIVSGGNLSANVTISGNDYDRIYENYFKLKCESTTTSVEITITSQSSAVDVLYNNALLTSSITIPVDTPGVYFVEYALQSYTTGERRVDTIRIEKPFGADFIEKKYDNILFVTNNPQKNGGYTFTHYEWRRDGEVISNSQYYSAESSEALIGTYQLKVTTDKGETINVCEHIERDNSISQSSILIKAYPNPVPKGGTITLQTDKMKAGADINIYDVQGNLVAVKVVTGTKTTIAMPSVIGNYLISVGGETLKVVVQ